MKHWKCTHHKVSYMCHAFVLYQFCYESFSISLAIHLKTMHFMILSVKFDDRISLHIMAGLKCRD